MKKYIYLHHNFGDFFVTDRLLAEEELYCAYCDEYDELHCVCETEEEFAAQVRALFLQTRDILPCDEYDEFRQKYAPAEVLEEMTRMLEEVSYGEM